ncbi:MAG: hypothetical protein IIW08_01895, partial [Clostridia bacterium]|nr:hypothetical protein [Clostridia bacterium]
MKNGDMNKILKDGFPSVPESFHLRVEETLRSIEQSEEQETMKGTFKKTWVFILAAVLIVGTAFAAGTQSHLMDFLFASNSAKPLENAGENIRKNLGSAQSAHAIYTLHEAVYDGECVRALLEVAPLSPETHAVYPSWDTEFVSEQLKGVPEGKIALDIPYPLMESNSDSVPMDFTNTFIEGMRQGEDGSIFMYLMSPVSIREYSIGLNEIVREADAPASILHAKFLSDPDAYYNGESRDSYARIPFTLNICPVETAEYVTDNMHIRNVSVETLTVTHTPFASYLEVSYGYENVSTGMTLSPDQTYYATKMGIFLHTVPDCSGMKNALALTCEEAIAFGKDFLCPVCAGGD